MSQTKVKVRKKKSGRRSIIKPTAEEIAAFVPNANEGFPPHEVVEAFMRNVAVVSARDYPGLPPTANDVLACPMTPEGMAIILGTMQAFVKAEGASYGVPCNGRGIILVAPNAKGDYVRGGADDGLKVTDDIVLVFDDVMLKPHSTEGEPPYVDPSRTDLCPNIRHVRLSDYSVAP
jgi:hypothetical protein